MHKIFNKKYFLIGFILVAGLGFSVKVEAATNVYYSVGQNVTDHKTGTPTLDIVSGVGTFDVAQTATNMGVGDKVTFNTSSICYISSKTSTSVWNLVTATGTACGDVTDATVNSIAHAFASLSTAISGALDANHLNTADLTSATGGNYILNFPSYYDSGPDAGVTVDGYTTSASNYIRIYTATSTTAEVNQSQRHNGTYPTDRFRIENGSVGVTISDDNVWIDGIAILNNGSSSSGRAGIKLSSSIGVGGETQISNSLIKGNFGGTVTSGYGIQMQSNANNPTAKIWNNIIYDIVFGEVATFYGIYVTTGVNYIYNNTIYNCRYGIFRNAGTAIAINNLLDMNNAAAGGIFSVGTDYNATNNAAIGYTVTGGGNSHDRNATLFPGIDFTYSSEIGDDFHLASTDTGAIDFGTPNPGSGLFSNDIDGQTRSGTWDIGADEYFGAGDTTNPVPGSSGTITTSSVNSNSLTLNWTKATDDTSAEANLQYRVYQSSLNNLDTVSNIEANGTPLNDYANDINILGVSGLSPSITYYFNIIVKDEAGNKAAYTTKLQETTAAADENIYIAQASAGSDTGANCANAHSAAWFNTSGNWANPDTDGKIGPGDTVHLCGTISTQLTVQENGSSGSPITIYFESGAKLSQPAANLMSTNGKDYLVIDGGTNGIIEATDNGTGLGNQLVVYGITASNSENMEIKNLTFQNLYVHTSVDDNTSWGTRPTAIYFNGTGSNISIHDNTFDDVTTAIQSGGGVSGGSNFDIYNNTFTNYDHGVSIGGAATSTENLLGYSDANIYNNHFGSTANWDTTSNLWHHDGIHIYHPMNDVLTGLNIYNNLFDGDWGENNTAQIFMEGEYGGTDNPGSGINDTTIFNNVFKNTNSRMNNGHFNINGLNTRILNNTIIGSGSDDICVMGGNNNEGFVFKNNILTSCFSFMGSVVGVPTDTNLDYNLYANGYPSGTGYFSWYATAGGTIAYTSTLATWQSWVQADSNSSYTSSVNLDSNGYLQASSAGIDSGTNLTSLNITALNSDKDGIARPGGSTAWDIGAYQFTGAPDTTSPTPGNSGTITTANISTTGLTLTWTKATDDTSSQSALVYRLYKSSSNNINSVANIFANGTAVTASTTDIATTDVTDLSPNTTYYFNIVVADGSGNSAVYTTKSETTTALSSTKAISVFDFNGLTPAVVGSVNETDKTIALTVPYGTAVTALVPTITQTGSSVSPASGVAQDFTNPATYTVTAADASTQAYVVTVTVATDTTPTPTPTPAANGPIYGSTRHNISNLLSTTTSLTSLQNQIAQLTAQLNSLLAQTSNTTYTPYNFTRNLYYRMLGNDVVHLQQFLNTHGFIISPAGAGSPGNETTKFGLLTYKALQKFQKSVGLPATGFFGPMTRAYVNKK